MPFRMYVDAEGIPYSDYGVYRGIAIGRQRSVLSVAERGMWYWNEYFRQDEAPVLLSYDWTRWPANFNECFPTKAEQSRRMLINCADWMLNNIEHRENFSVWTYPYAFSYATGPGWRSAHPQAVGLQLLVRAAGISDSANYMDPAESLLRAFSVNLTDGGLSTRTELGEIWFEKMADENNRQPKVLNGLLFTIFVLEDIATRTRLPQASRLAEAGARAAIELLPRFDLGDWSAYDIHGKRASPHYHDIHIRQLELLAELTGRAEFATYRDLFRAQKELAPSRRHKRVP